MFCLGRIDIKNAGAALKYGKCITVREYQLVNEYAVILKHFTSNASNTMAGSKSILLFATTKSTIYALDLLTMEIVWKLQNAKSHGVITSMVIDPKNTWLLVGTTRGILTLYDLRFQIMLRSWMHPSKSCISDLVLTPDARDTSQDKMLVRIAAGRNEISVWDIEYLQCLEVFAVKSGDEKTTGVLLESYKALEAPSEKDILLNSFTNNESNLAENSIRTVAAPAGHHFMITGGSDRKIRFWDTARVDNSSVVLGLDIDEPKPRYR
jgi:phosphoinositide-3-kinase regulatory subunit 4